MDLKPYTSYNKNIVESGSTARHAQELGFRTAIVRDLSCRITVEGAQVTIL
jgi:hypothetical protein